MEKGACLTAVISHRAGETVAMYNQLLRIEEALGGTVVYKGRSAIKGQSFFGQMLNYLAN